MKGGEGGEGRRQGQGRGGEEARQGKGPLSKLSPVQLTLLAVHRGKHLEQGHISGGIYLVVVHQGCICAASSTGAGPGL